MKILILGGPRNGEWVEALDGSRTWVDLQRADTYVIRRIPFAQAGPDGRPSALWFVHIAAHPSFAGNPKEPEIGQSLFMVIVGTEFMVEYMQRHGEPQPLQEDPPIPDTPAALFGADGKPIGGGA